MVLFRVKSQNVKKDTREIKKSCAKLKKDQGEDKTDKALARPGVQIGRSLNQSGLCPRARHQVRGSEIVDQTSVQIDHANQVPYPSVCLSLTRWGICCVL